MDLSKKLLTAWLVPVTMLASATVAACRDGAPAGPVSDDALVTPSAHTESERSLVRARLHSRNPQDWVGAAHNEMLDDFRKELRKPGVLTNDVCEYGLRFGMHAERLRNGRTLPPQIQREALRAGGLTSRLCSGRVHQGAVMSAALAPPPAAVAAEAEAMVGQIEAAIDAASDSYDLAVRLTPVLDAAAQLDDTSHAVIAATVSVAQSSFEYWEVQYPSFEQEVASEYGACARDLALVGYDEESARNSCLNGGGFQTRWRPRSGPFNFLRLASFPLPEGRLRCGVGLGAGFRRIGRDDARGAFAGGVTGAIAGGPAGAGGGAVLGGGIGSTWAALENAWSVYWCMVS